MADKQKAIQTLEQEYSQQKEGFEKWKDANSAQSGHESYAQYVEQFRTWEKTVLDRLKEMRTSIMRQPLVPEPELPVIDMDTQIENILKEITPPHFILAFMSMAQKDQVFLKKAFEVVMEECRGAGFTNPILPQQPIHTSRSTPSFGGYHPPSLASGIGQSSASSAGSSSINYPSQSYVPGSSLLNNRYTGTPPTASTSYTQITPYGLIPEGWTLNPAIRKLPKPASPTREYRSPLNLPFKDFSQV